MNLVDCHDEKIHISGHIQDFGYLIGLDASGKTITFLSQNISDIFSVNENVLGQTLEQNCSAFEPLLDSVVLKNLDFETLKEVDVFLDKLTINGNGYHLTIYKYQSVVFLEIEKVTEHFHTRTFVTKKYESISNATDSAEIWQQLLVSVAEAIDYDRVMVYRFLDDGSGKVIAEKIKNGVESFMNLHYPESDIPRQARELYLKKRKRIFSNVLSTPVPILTTMEQPVDLTYSALRAMSPVHGQYLKNTGVESSFSTSIVIDNKLWGMVTCQNVKAKHIDLVNRIRAEVFTVIAANAYASFKSRQMLNDSIELENQIKDLKSSLSKFDDLESSLFSNIETMRNYPHADGLAVVVGHNIRTAGLVPSDEDILNIVKYARENPLKNFYSTNDFSKSHQGNMGPLENAAGVMFGFTDDDRNELLIWFRQKVDTQLLWAGNPSKDTGETVLNGDQQYVISPRKSFATYIENIKGKATPWKNRDIIAAKKVVASILETTYSQFRKVRELNDELRNLNEELDSFSYTISHDLGTPLTVMKLNAQLLERAHHDNPEVQKRVQSILAEVLGMENMMRGVLQLSKAKSSEIVLRELETASVIRKICLDAQLTISESTEVIIGKTPNVLGDETMMKQVFLNIIGNAVKYSSKSENPKVEIHGYEEDDKVIYTIKDNGIGIPAKDQSKMFKIFSRMENAKAFQGNGVGLSIVYRIMKRLGGNISYKSTAAKETIFKLTFQNPRSL
ncbi:Bacteriophytochrome (light-regulated signal transduction histidine kinase) [Kaistella treverensis]|uniref:histidine kinase n=1 Tax=Kaistella treverensis TaxID=631455 RepID=A0A1I3N4R4_9FLAO|nr:ATP-binding protein [Kaistella treverensis]SFJ03836.1 Bacteriophytochrome (light-regulated signal transduction histidine kinase) [Kaistella treverensis]